MILDPSAFVADSELIQALEEQSTPISCDEDRVLFHQGDAPVGLFILKSGPVTLSMTSARRRRVDLFPRQGRILAGTSRADRR